MSEAHYIEIDEEIISVVSRLRNSKTVENIFILPKRSLILQSIINLKLLKREAEKLGKAVSIMTQDEQGMRLAEKAGLTVQEYQDTKLRQYRAEAPTRFTVRHGESIPMPEPPKAQDGLRRSSEIGSADFSNMSQRAPSPLESADPLVSTRRLEESELSTKKLRIRNASPPTLTALNSKRAVGHAPSTPPSIARSAVPLSEPDLSPEPRRENRLQLEQKEKVRRLFEGRVARIHPTERSNNPLPPVSQKIVTEPPVKQAVVTGSGHWFWWSGAGIVLIATMVTGYFFLRPEAIIALEPQTASQTVKLSLVGTVAQEGTSTIPVRYVEQEKTVRLTREATGDASGNGTKSSGTITILNSFSEAVQSLVGTTRFELSDGRVYRLVEGVTVPGMKLENGTTIPGKVDARVIADSAGTKYNISSGTFTIPGFKGSPKFEKIQAEAKGPFVGGREGTASTTKSISEADLEKAKSAATEEVKRLVIDEWTGMLKAGEAVLAPSINVSLIGVPNVPVAGAAADASFEYEARLLAKGFIINESAVKSIIDQQSTETGGIALRPFRYVVNYGTILANFESKRVDLTVESKVLFRAPLNVETLKQGLLGQDEDGIRKYLSDHPEIKRLQVEFKPKVFIATIPDDPKRVTLNILEAESE
jgi:hypothetical protein